jgi:hypothetical protein
MRVEQSLWCPDQGWAPQPEGWPDPSPSLVFLFGSSDLLADEAVGKELRSFYPEASFFGCSTAGEIRDTEVYDGKLVVTAVRFDHTTVEGAVAHVSDAGESFEAGERLARALSREGLAHVIVLSDGINVNGSELVAGLMRNLPANVTVTGGLSGDGDRFEETKVLWNDRLESHSIAAVGLYGDRLSVGYGSLGGWDAFGPERLVTRSEGNVLYELDGRSALQLYKEYLGEHADGLPATGLLFPLSIRTETDATPVVRTILSVDESNQSLTFAGDVPQGAYSRLMKANFNRLLDGAAGAAGTTHEALDGLEPQLALLISCVGRKLVLKQRVEEEVEAVRDVLGEGAVLTGFYSYGEISPFTPNARCELHNQTMTITALSEG